MASPLLPRQSSELAERYPVVLQLRSIDVELQETRASLRAMDSGLLTVGVFSVQIWYTFPSSYVTWRCLSAHSLTRALLSRAAALDRRVELQETLCLP